MAMIYFVIGLAGNPYVGAQEDDSHAGIFEGIEYPLGIFYVRYYDKVNPLTYYIIPYYFDEETKVIYKDKTIRIDQLKVGDKISVVVRSSGGGRHFNIEKSDKHIAQEIILIKK